MFMYEKFSGKILHEKNFMLKYSYIRKNFLSKFIYKNFSCQVSRKILHRSVYIWKNYFTTELVYKIFIFKIHSKKFSVKPFLKIITCQNGYEKLLRLNLLEEEFWTPLRSKIYLLLNFYFHFLKSCTILELFFFRPNDWCNTT